VLKVAIIDLHLMVAIPIRTATASHRKSSGLINAIRSRAVTTNTWVAWTSETAATLLTPTSRTCLSKVIYALALTVDANPTRFTFTTIDPITQIFAHTNSISASSSITKSTRIGGVNRRTHAVVTKPHGVVAQPRIGTVGVSMANSTSDNTEAACHTTITTEVKPSTANKRRDTPNRIIVDRVVLINTEPIATCLNAADIHGDSIVIRKGPLAASIIVIRIPIDSVSGRIPVRTANTRANITNCECIRRLSSTHWSLAITTWTVAADLTLAISTVATRARTSPRVEIAGAIWRVTGALRTWIPIVTCDTDAEVFVVAGSAKALPRQTKATGRVIGYGSKYTHMISTTYALYVVASISRPNTLRVTSTATGSSDCKIAIIISITDKSDPSRTKQSRRIYGIIVKVAVVSIERKEVTASLNTPNVHDSVPEHGNSPHTIARC
jgi:hypothetical protein